MKFKTVTDIVSFFKIIAKTHPCVGHFEYLDEYDWKDENFKRGAQFLLYPIEYKTTGINKLSAVSQFLIIDKYDETKTPLLDGFQLVQNIVTDFIQILSNGFEGVPCDWAGAVSIKGYEDFCDINNCVGYMVKFSIDNVTLKNCGSSIPYCNVTFPQFNWLNNGIETTANLQSIDYDLIEWTVTDASGNKHTYNTNSIAIANDMYINCNNNNCIDPIIIMVKVCNTEDGKECCMYARAVIKPTDLTGVSSLWCE